MRNIKVEKPNIIKVKEGELNERKIIKNVTSKRSTKNKTTRKKQDK